MKTDSLFYRLFQTFPPLLFDLLKFTPVNSNYKFKSVEIKQPATMTFYWQVPESTVYT
ncbi:DUF2887 domain-containing protein [Dolichospermum sp. LEGE 00240]|uniref:DUF2887 domain-containing protein n=1 Tax=Dolichospermum sp. LEGE 00240 TaxID=1828603 RepID=UPI00187F038D|nr:DUF2887 domain-containing protein [Dolichospermum sp. LEGE 00240]